ncbi:MAG: leucyl/phenylalanyl-tRNA--protein transferase [Rhodocyclales bacterium CG_4_10_14_3_um_filter_68_10]|nr:MAG: leucyl/phenylalanyl-tRNA--protein transferase [Rhodocyclales bacterium CG_4_10_14_3_um_filter_68_10]
MSIPWLGKNQAFPPPKRALRDPNGLLAAGGDLSAARLLAAYAQGIFPWYAPGEPILWWSPDPRMVLFPAEFRISRSLRRTLARDRYRVLLDTAFAEVIAGCANAPRRGQNGTWISAEMQSAYLRLHRMGHAHSVETWIDGELAGGLYGVAIGRVFFGESMFSRAADASKIAAAHLARILERRGFAVIDCQMSTAHLASLGAREIARSQFVAGVRTWTREGEGPGTWPAVDAAGIFDSNR